MLPAFVRRSVSRKVTALVVATTLAALTIAGVALLFYDVSGYRDTKVAEIQTQAEIIGRASAPALAFDDPDEAARDLMMLEARPDVENAAIYDAEGTLFAAYARGGDTIAIPRSAPEVGRRIEEDRIRLAYPIVEDGQRLGTVVLDARFGLRDRLTAYALIVGGVMAVALLSALLLSAWLQRAVTRPILRLADAARAVIARRDFSVRAGRTTDDEIGTLASAMNRMLGDLEREIAERKAAEETLRDVDRRKDEFLATLAHELRNPLAPIRNALYLMRLENAPPQALTEARAIIDRQVQQMVRLVDDLLEVSRITTGKLALRRERVELRKVAAAAIEAVEPLIVERKHRLTVALPPDGLSLEADPTRLAQVFANLLNNAAKFTPAGGTIDFSLDVADGEMVGRVRDSGVGIPEEMIEPIFEMFAQADRSLERTTMGLGVGLSLSRKLIELHGGTIEARSEGAGKGSEFIVRMPAVAVMQAHGVGTAARADDAATAYRPRVLIVDDNEDFALTLGRMLRLRGYDVRVEHDGLAGLAAVQEFRPQVAFLDIGMPKMNGYELAQHLRAHPATADCTLVAVTGWGQEEDRLRTERSGFHAHLVKPVDPEILLELLATLGKSRAQA